MHIQVLFVWIYVLFTDLTGCYGVKNITNKEILDISKRLVDLDENYIPMNLDFCNGKKSDKLFNKGCPDFNSKPTFKKMIALLDNYDPNVNDDENDTPDEKKEIESFLDEVVKTKVAQELQRFFKEKELLSNEKDALKNLFKQIFFCVYSRSKNHKSSTGFEHIEIGEFKRGQVSGGHGWANFCLKEQLKGNDRIKFLNATKCYGEQRVIGGIHFSWQNFTKPISSMFVGVSPEFQLSVDTLCMMTRENKTCKVDIKKDVIAITAFSMTCDNGKALGSAFPKV